MAEGTAAHRSFADAKHVSGQWRAQTMHAARGPRRAALSYLSFKRKGVDALATATPAGSFVLDLGAGQGAYCHWFLDRREAVVIAIDWSREALARIAAPRRGTIIRICADAGHLPIKSESIDALFSVDTLGHVPSVPKALDELLRAAKPGARLFLHSECSNYRARWPDTMLLKRIGHDYLAEYDGHGSLFPYEELRSLYSRRFSVDAMQSPAGLIGWLIGYPEKYRLAFDKAGCKELALLCTVFALIKTTPGVGAVLRLFNAVTNHFELALGIQGGGSCSARLHKPAASSRGVQ